jgi:hypothetical protein
MNQFSVYLRDHLLFGRNADLRNDYKTIPLAFSSDFERAKFCAGSKLWNKVIVDRSTKLGRCLLAGWDSNLCVRQ